MYSGVHYHPYITGVFIGSSLLAAVSSRCGAEAPPGRTRAGDRGAQSPLRPARGRVQIRVWLSPSSSANRLAKIGAGKDGSSSFRLR